MIPTRPADCDRAGIPTIDCPPIPVVTYEVPLTGGYNPELAAEFLPPELLPAIAIGNATTEITPAPPGGGTVSTAMGLAMPLQPITGAPTLADVPASWQEVQPEQPGSTFVGVILPLSMVTPVFGTGTPFWLRQTYTDENGCVTHVFLFFPNGLQEEPTETTIYVIVNEDPTVVEVTVEPPVGDPTDPGPTVDLTLEVTPTCPDTGRYVPVGPACGEESVPVGVVGAVEVTNPQNEGGNVPLQVGGSGIGGSVPTSILQRGLTVTTLEETVAPAAPNVTVAIPGGWTRIVVQGAGDPAGIVRVLCDGIEYASRPDPDGYRPPVVIDAPEGFTGTAAELSVQNAAGAADVVGLAAIYTGA